MEYAVMMGNEQAGKVRVQREGLYYRFCCRCRLSGDVVCRLAVRCGEREENLGVLVPMEEGFGVDKRIPVKHLGEGEMEFLLLPKSDRIGGMFIPIRPEEPFAYIARLQDAFFARRNGQAGVVLNNKQGTA